MRNSTLSVGSQQLYKIELIAIDTYVDLTLTLDITY